MKMSKCEYDGMDWLDALKKVKPQQEQEAKLAAKTEDAETVESALEDTSKIVFGLPDERTKPEVIMDASKESMDKAAQARVVNEINGLKDKLKSNGVDPVSLGVVSKAEWDAMANVSKAEQLAKKAALLAEKNAKREWEERAMKELHGSKKASEYNPEFDKLGRVAPMTAKEDAVSSKQQLPKNAASIADPTRIDKLASEPTEHDKAVTSIRQEKARKEIEAAKAKYQTNIPDDFVPMKSSGVIRSGAKNDEDAGIRYKAPANQISMTDDVSGASPQEIKDKLEKLFMDRIADHGADIRKANEERKASISRPEPKNEEPSKQTPTSTKDMQQRLMELWMPETPDKKE